ncbi:MAG: 4-oxalomesaconate tautomerase [Paracoccaceae bacterium]|jgi:4-oxalomesaconate tautomerase
MSQTSIPYVFMRGGSSRGPYFKKMDLPEDLHKLSEVLLAVVGSGHPLNIDGVGGGNAVTTKVAILSKSKSSWADIDYFFAQVSVEDRIVDFKPTCGNILSGVASAAIEMGLFPASDNETFLKIRSVNTGAEITAKVQTPNRQVSYSGKTKIDGVPGSAAPVELNFMKVAGSSTGSFLPTGNLIDQIDGMDVTCMDVAMPMVIARAEDFGLSGHETREQLDSNKEFFGRMEKLRIKAGKIMNMGNVVKSVTPKFGLLAPPRQGGSIAARYFMPWKTHPTMAVTGSQCLASCALTPGTVADGMLERPKEKPAKVTIEHPMGKMQVLIDYHIDGNIFQHKSAGLVRTCRKIAEGFVFIPKEVWNKDSKL